MKAISPRKIRRARAARAATQPRRLRPLGVSLARYTSALAVASALFAGTASSQAATYYWDSDATAAGNNATTGAGLGGTGTWDLTLANWWDLTNDILWPNLADTAIFTGTAGTVTLGVPITTGGLTFNTDGYTLTGSTLTLAGPATINAAFGTVAKIDSIVAGTSGLTKTGAGTVWLTNTGNTFSGDLVINDGTIVVSDPAQLGTGTTAISINGIANTGNPGFSGGSLVLQGGMTGSGMTINREISVGGRGPNAANAGGGLISNGYNTIAGGVVIGNPGTEGRLLATHGITTITGGVQLGTGASALFYGNGNWIISGKVTGFDATTQDRLIKPGGAVASTLWLQNNSNDFAQPLRIDGANSGGNGVRVSSNAALGASTSTLGLDMNGGVLEVRTDAPDFNNRNINFRGTTSRIFVDHALGSSLVNQNVVIGGVLTNSSANASIVHSGRNGYNLSLGNGSVMNWPAGGNLTIYNTESSGTLTFNASISRASEGTARTLTITPSGEIIFTGDILQVGAGAVSLTKNNTGMLTLQGTGTSTATGTTNINAGTITISSFGQLPTGQVKLGNGTTTAGALNYAGAGETSSAAISLNTTTANSYLNANGTGALVLDGTITAVAGNKTLVLGGASTAANEIASAIPNSTNLSVQKIGSGTWVLSGANAFTGGSGVTISGGTLQVKDTYSGGSRDVIGDANAVVFNTDLYSQAAGGTFEYLGAATSTSSENLGTLTATTGAGTIKVTPGTGGTATLTFGSLGTVATGTGVNVLNTGTVNVTGTAGFLNPHITYNGVDFAYSGGGTTLRAPVYDTDAGFVTAGAALTGSSHNLVNSSTSTGVETISSLKISGSQTVDQTGLLTIQTAPGAPGGIIQTGGAGIIQGTGITTGGSGDLVVRVDGSGDSLTLAAPITNTTDGGLTKNGAGLLLLQGAQAYDGTTTVNEGMLKVDTGSRLGGGSASNNNNLTVRQDGALDINGNNLGVAAFNGAGAVTNSSATAATLTIGNNNQSGYYSGLITGNLGITKAGTGGAMSITGANTFTGATTLGGGTLIVNNLANIGVASAIGAGDATNNATNAASLVFNGGTLRYQGSNSVLFQNTQTPSVSTDRLFTLAANGSIESSGSFGAPTLSYTSNNAALVFSNTAPVAFSGAGARTLTLAGDSNGDNRINLQLIDNPNASEPLSVTKAGSSNGLWILGNTGNSYSGNTTISAGYLQVGDDSAALTRTLPTTSALVLGTTTTSGILQTSGLFTRPIAATATPGSVTWGGTTGGGGFSASPGRLTVNLGGAGATLTWGSGGFVGTGGTQTLFLSSNTAVADVELVNGIDLNGANRTIQVDDNVYTGLDYATISGVISNTGSTAAGFTKSGGGNLILAGANTYNGNTTISSGALIVGSIGAAGDTSGSLGTNVGGGNLLIGNGTTTGGILLYVGPGETTTRTITLNTTTATNTIDSSGSGPLVLTSVTNGVAGAKTLYLRGTNTDLNTVTSVFANNGGALSVQKYDGGVWVLNPSSANTFTGDLVAGGGTLGLTANGIGSAARLRFSNGAVTAWGGDLTTSVPVSLANNTTTVFSGKNNITFNSNVTKDAGANDQTFSNNLENGAVLTINGNYVNLEAPSSVATRIVYVRGFGSTVWNGIIQNEAANKSLTLFDIRIADNASFTLGNANTLTGGIRLGQGTLIVGNTLGLGPAANTVTLYGGTLTSTVDLAGANKIANQVVLSGDQVMINGSQNIELGASSVALLNSGGNRFLRNELDAGKTLTISGKVSLTNDGGDRTLTLRGAGETVISGIVQNGGTGKGGLAYSGLSTLTLTGANTATGNLTVNRNTIVLSGTSGGSWNSGPVTVNPIGTLRLDNSGGDNPAGRLNNSGAFTGNGGTLDIISDSDGTSEVTGVLTLNSVQTFVTLTDNSGGAGNTLTFDSVSLPNSGSSLNLAGVPNLGGINKVKFTTAPTGNALINSVAPRFFIGGDFATYDATDGVKAFSNYNPSSATDINAAAATDTIEVNAGMTTPNLTASRTVNALKINGTGLSAGGTGKTMTLAAAAILNTGGNNSLDLNGVNFGSNTGIIQVESGTTLTVNSTLMGTSSWAKTLPGTLTINTPTFINGTTNILRGTVKLNAGLNTLFPNQLLNMNDGATLDLNGNTQFTGYLTDPGILPESGGLITSSAGTGTLVTNMAAASALFATNINGNVNFARVGGNTLTLESVNTYSGSTTLMGGTLQIQDDSSILNTSSIAINGATLTLNNNSSLQRAIYDRVGDTTPITLRTGAIYFYGKVSDPSYEVMGPVTAAEGANTISVGSGGTGTAGAFTSADVTFASLTRAAGATVNFAGTSGLGIPGNNARIFFTTPLTTQGSGVLGAWAIGNYTDYAAYNTTNGVSYVGSGGYTGYDSDFGTGKITGIGTLANSNVTTTLPGSTTTALLRLSGNFTNNLAFTAGSDVLNLELGGILRSNNAFDTTIGTTATRGVITAGGTEVSGTRELVIYNYATGNPSFGGATINPTTTSVTMSSTVGLQPGMTIANANFPAGTTVVSIPSLSQVILSQPSTNATQQTSQTFTGGSFVNGVTTSGSAAVTMNSTVGLAPGMTLTGTNIPTGSYIVSVDSATQVTLSQNATATGSAITFTGGVSNMIVNSVIADNGFGNSVMLVKSGNGVLNLSANNTYTGGTVVNQGTLNLIGSGVVIPAGGVTVNNSALTMLTNNGQIASSNTVTLIGDADLTLAGTYGADNTLDRLIFNNNGGSGTSTVSIPTGSILNLTNSTPVTITSNNAAVTPTISGGFLGIGAGANTFNIGEIQAAGQTYTRIHPTLNISSAITGLGSSMTKTGGGLLQLSGQSNFTGGVALNAGAIIIGTNSTPISGGTGLTSGPLGTGALTVGSGLTLLVDTSSRTFGNDVTFAGTPTFDATSTNTVTLTLNGQINGLPNGAVTVNVINPYLTVNLLGTIPNIASITSITSSGLGKVFFNSAGYTGNYAAGGSNVLSIFHDGNGTGQLETINLGSATFDPGVVPNITIGRAGGTLPFNLALNKTIELASITSLTSGLTLTNNNQYKLRVPDAIALASGAAFSVANATNSNYNEGLELSGILSGSTFTKSGNGALLLSNTGNTFTGNMTVTQGVLAVADNAALGNAANMVILAPAGSDTATFRATDNITTARVISFGTTTGTRAIEVVAGKTLELTSTFDLTGGAGAVLTKNDQGILVLNADNDTAGWTGGMTINGGAVRAVTAGALGALGQVNIPSVFGAALQLGGGLTVNNPININNGVTNIPQGGINFGGQLQNFAGTNTYSGAITMSADAGIGADAGTTLNITGGISMATSSARALFFNAQGDINISGTSLTGGAATAWHRIEKMGPGTLTISNTNSIAITGDTVKVRQGTLAFTGAGTLSGATLGFLLEQGGTLSIDNTGTNTNNRLGARPMILEGGTFNYTANGGVNSSETMTTLSLNSGGSTINMVNGGAASSILTYSALTQNGGGSLNLTGTFGSASNALKFTTAPALLPAGTGLLARVTVNGNEFATYNATNGVTTFTGYAPATNILSAGATQTFQATSSTANSLTTNQTLNALNLNAGGMNVGAVSGLIPTTLTLTSGAVLTNGGGGVSTLAVPVVSLSVEGFFHVQAGQELQVSSGLMGTAGFTKALGGNLSFTGQQFYSGTTTVNGGTMKLMPAATNTLLFNNSLTVNTGATFDLNGGTQFIGNLASSGAGPQTGVASGGTVTNSSGTATLVTNGSSSFGGQITGAINLVKSSSTLNLTNVNSYTGTTTVTGGTITLADNGALTNTTAIELNYATITAGNRYLYENNDRINDAAPITLRGGMLNFDGRAQSHGSETIGDITVAQGLSFIFPNNGGTGVNSFTLNMGKLLRAAGSTATLRFNQGSVIGLLGSNPRAFFTEINGVTTTNIGDGLNNNIIGPWAIVDRDWATYVPTLGVGTLGSQGFAGYAGSGILTAPLATDNVRYSIATGTTVLPVDTVVSTLNI